MHLLEKEREIAGVKNCWTVDGRIVANRRDKKMVTIPREEHLEKLTCKWNFYRSGIVTLPCNEHVGIMAGIYNILFLV